MLKFSYRQRLKIFLLSPFFLFYRIVLSKVRILSKEETISIIQQETLSIARYGDGEFLWMNGLTANSYEDATPPLASGLQEAFYTEERKLLVCINPRLLLRELRWLDKRFQLYYKDLFWGQRHNILHWAKEGKVYGNQCINYYWRERIHKPSVLEAESYFSGIKAIWNGKRVLVAEGETPGFGVGNDLLSGAFSVTRLPFPERLFASIKRAEERIASLVDSFDVAILILGPSATVLSFRLAQEYGKNGKQFLDFGSLDEDYNLFLLAKNSH